MTNDSADVLAARMRATQTAAKTIDADINAAVGSEWAARDALQAAMVETAMNPKAAPQEEQARARYAQAAEQVAVLKARQAALTKASATLHEEWQQAVQRERSDEHSRLDRHLRALLPDLVERLTNDLAALRLLSTAQGGTVGAMDWNGIFHRRGLGQDVIARRAGELRIEILNLSVKES